MYSLILIPLFTLTSPMTQARIHVRNEAWGEAIASLKGYKPHDNELVERNFILACSHCRLNHKEKAIAYAEKVVDEFALPVPRRYRSVSELIIAEAESWKDEDLDDIYRDMKAVKDRLKNRQAGKETQKAQKKILDRLDKMIKDKEAEAEAAAKAKADSEARKRARARGDSQAKPLEDIELPSGPKAKGEIDLKKFKEYADVWGKLPQKERAKAMTELTRNLPPKYREAIESYFKKLERKR